MKNLTKKSMLAAATVLVASAVASAASVQVEIPFAFRAGGVVLAPGTYKLTPVAGERWFQIRSLDSRTAFFVPAGIQEYPPQAWEAAGRGVLEFGCGGGPRCSLKRIWTANGTMAHQLEVPKEEAGKPTRVALIPLVAVRGN